MLNPQNATIGTPDGSIVTQFRLRYLYAGNVVANVLVTANYVTTSGGVAQFVQSLSTVNAAVPLSKQGADLTLVVNPINDGGEGPQTSCPTTIQVVNPPDAAVSVTVA